MGDFALFVFYLEFVSELTAFFGLLVARYQQIGVSVERMYRLMEGAPARRWSSSARSTWTARCRRSYPARRDDDSPANALDVRGLSYHYPGTENGIADINLRAASAARSP